MTDGAAVLHDLARAAGIATRYRDAWGHERAVSEATLQALLRALGIDPADAAASAALIEAEWRRAMATATIIAEEERAPTLPVVLEAAEGALDWRLVLEDGSTREGRAELGLLRRSAEHALDGGRLARFELPLPTGLPRGYHRLRVDGPGICAEASLIVAPERCYLPPPIAAGRHLWALTTQLYSLRSARDWGIGDFTDLAQLAQGAAAEGAAALGLNPLHALFPAEPRHRSPYSPSSRRYLNPLYLDVEAIPEFTESEAAQRLVGDPAFKERLAAARRGELVDYAAVSALKRPILDCLYETFRARDLGDVPGGAITLRGEAFRAFQRDSGDDLRRFAIFEALHEYALSAGHGFCWRAWPEPLRDPGSREVERFAHEQATSVEFFQYLQWESDRQLGEAARLGRGAGLTLGLYRDLAVGVDPNGGSAWADHELLVPGVAIGAPPDLLNLKGQNWGLAPISPVALRARGYAPFIASLRANMRHAGALRVDHVMALQHLYWIPEGAEAAEGAYVSYPIADLVRLVALESHRNHCLVIGEDLGTVPSGFRERMAAADILSYRVLVFERTQDSGFMPPESYPALASAAVATHDIATLKGYWLGRDIDWRERLDLYPSAELRAGDRRGRAHDRRQLVEALIAAGLLPENAREWAAGDATPAWRPELTLAVHRYLARAEARLLLVQIEDVLGEAEQANLPGTVDEHPNWQRRLGTALEDILTGAALARLAEAIGDERRRADEKRR